jgi:hypothetical protein
MKFLSLFFWLVCAAYQFSAMGRAYGHGFAGARFFPATLSTDDPFVSDELSLPTVSTIRLPGDGGTRETDISMDLSKRISLEFAIEIGDTFTALNPHEGPAANGFGNLELGGKYQLLKTASTKRLSQSDLAWRSVAPARARSAPTHLAPGRQGFFSAKALAIYPWPCGS